MAEKNPQPTRSAAPMTEGESTSMHAVVYSKYGGPEVLRYTRVQKPTPDEDEVLVRVVAASVGAGDWHLMRGTPFLVRLIYGGYRSPKLPILGVDIAGRVEAVGRNVTGVHPGEEVVADLSESGFGAFAEYVCVRATAVVSKPPTVPFEVAATLPTSGVTALQALRDAGGIQAGEHVLINGASGGVGSFAVQIAKALGAEVSAVCSTAKMETVRSIGADHVVDYTTEDVTTSEEKYDLIVDTAGSHSMRAYSRILTPEGRYVMVGGPTSRFISSLVFGPMLSLLGRQQYHGFSVEPSPDDLQYLLKLVESSDLTPVIDRQYPLQQVPDAIRSLEAGRATGKLVISSA